MDCLERVVVIRTMVGTAIAASTGCSYGGSFVDCEVSCTQSTGCPPGFTCSASSPGEQGLCWSGATAPSCGAILDGSVDGNVDAGTCLTYFSDETSFDVAKGTLALNIEDFTRKADGSPTQGSGFAYRTGDYFFWRGRLTFKTRGVNNAPGQQSNQIVVGGNDATITIMSGIGGATARDAIVATFTPHVAAVAFRPSDDEGTQSYVFEVTTTSGTTSFPVATAKAPFVGVVNGCGNAIVSAALVSPTPSHWWRLFGVTFGP
jgi:hypothetical protein